MEIGEGMYHIGQGSIHTSFSKSVANKYSLYNASKIKDFVSSANKSEIAEIAYFV